MGILLDGLAPKHRLFWEEYLKDLVATKAAIRASYSAKTAYQQGYALLRKPEIAKAIEAILASPFCVGRKRSSITDND